FLLAGKPPFGGGAVSARLMAHMTREPPSLTTARPDVPAALAAVVRKLMAKRPDDRYANAAEAAHALEDWPHQATPSEASGPTRRPFPRTSASTGSRPNWLPSSAVTACATPATPRPP